MPSISVELTQTLIRLNTISPPGNEEAAAQVLAQYLSKAGFAIELPPGRPGRPNLIARAGDPALGTPLAFTGHLDTVPLGQAAWSVDPHGGEIKDGKIWGRGTSDMKSGVAAFVVAASELAQKLAQTAGVVLYITAGEETGSEGAFAIAAGGIKGHAGALVVAEPTSNRPLAGHKGALWLKAVSKGVTAHGSMPDKGVNAVYRAARAITQLEGFDFNVARHPVMGAPTLNVGFVHGGLNVNSVPDRAEVGVDIRSIPGMRHDLLKAQLSAFLGDEVEIQSIVDVESVWTDPSDPWLSRVFEIYRRTTGGEPAVETATYFTDASALTPALGGVPTVILGPGPAHMAHQTDEYCELAKIDEAVLIYRQLIADWCGIEI